MNDIGVYITRDFPDALPIGPVMGIPFLLATILQWDGSSSSHFPAGWVRPRLRRSRKENTGRAGGARKHKNGTAEVWRAISPSWAFLLLNLRKEDYQAGKCCFSS
jgi:hypothetical protein